MNLSIPISLNPIAFWLTEEKPDKSRRVRRCLGCGDAQEYLTKEPAPSYVAWFKEHLPCRELYSPKDTLPTGDIPTEIKNIGMSPKPADTVGMSPAPLPCPKEWDGWEIGDTCEVRSTAGSGWVDGIVVKPAPKLKVRKCEGKTVFSPFDIRRMIELPQIEDVQPIEDMDPGADAFQDSLPECRSSAEQR